MDEQNNNKGIISRRKFLGTAAAATAAISLAPLNYQCKGASGSKPNSRIGGVQIGAITYSWRSMPGTAQDILRYCLQAGISSIELMSPVVEEFAGIPLVPARPGNTSALSPEEKASFDASVKAANEERRRWRSTVSMKKFEEFRKMYNDAGVKIHIAKFSPAGWSDEEIDYSFKAAKALGSIGVCNEIGEEAARRLGPFAEKHGMYAIFHQHAQPADPAFSFDTFLSYSPANMLNFDAGHYFGCTGLHPNGIIERLHDRIVSIHLKDKTGPKSDPSNTNKPWGQGEMPIADVLKLIQKEKWPINCDIELEYIIPEGSDAAIEVKKCVDFCRPILA
jgi:sugar phosphate isomerase/epimerase